MGPPRAIPWIFATSALLWLGSALSGCPYDGDPEAWTPDDDTTDDGDDAATGDDDSTGSADDDSAGDDDTTPAPEPPSLQSITPLSGPLAGGTEVELSGEHFDGGGDVRVYFGALDATVVSVEPERIVALSPALEGCLTLDVTVLNDAGYSLLQDAYTGCDTFAGATGAIARHARLEVVDPGVPGLAVADGVGSWAMVLTPTTYSPDDDFPSEGCVRDFAAPSPVLTPRAAGLQARYSAPAGDVVLDADGSGGYGASAGLGSWASAAEYAVVFEGGAGFAAETAAGALVTPDGELTVTPPLDDWQGTSITLGGSLLIEVAGGSPGDHLRVWIDFFDGAAQPAGNLVCSFAEDSIPLVSPAFLAGLPAGHAAVQVTRQNRRDVTLGDGSTLAGDARVTVVGGWTVEP